MLITYEYENTISFKEICTIAEEHHVFDGIAYLIFDKAKNRKEAMRMLIDPTEEEIIKIKQEMIELLDSGKFEKTYNDVYDWGYDRNFYLWEED